MTRQWLDLHHPDSRASLYLRAVGKRKISGSELPTRGLRCYLPVVADNLAAYQRLCHFPDDGRLPATYPHVMAFNLQLHLLTSSDFPFPLLGLVHLHNSVEVRRPLGGLEGLRMSVWAENLQPHAKGGTFDLISEGEDGLGLLWRETSRMLVRGLKLEQTPASEEDGEASPDEATPDAEAPALKEASRWYADADIGRCYAKVAGDYNPIHLSAASARLFGFPSAIAHGMWSKAMALAALRGHLPKSGYRFEVDFHKPIRLPAEVVLSASEAGPAGELLLHGSEQRLHMSGRWAVL